MREESLLQTVISRKCFQIHVNEDYLEASAGGETCNFNLQHPIIIRSSTDPQQYSTNFRHFNMKAASLDHTIYIYIFKLFYLCRLNIAKPMQCLCSSEIYCRRGFENTLSIEWIVHVLSNQEFFIQDQINIIQDFQQNFQKIWDSYRVLCSDNQIIVVS